MHKYTNLYIYIYFCKNRNYGIEEMKEKQEVKLIMQRTLVRLLIRFQ